MAGKIEIRIPDIGDFDEVEIVEVLVAVGDRVEAEDTLITLESDKASMEIPSPAAGVVQTLEVKLGDHVSEGTLVCLLEVEAAGTSDSADSAADSEPRAAQTSQSPQPSRDIVRESSPVPAASEPPGPPPPAKASADATSPPYASPLVRGFARELGVDLRGAEGSGPHGRVQMDDVKAQVRQVLSGQGASLGAAPSGVRQVDYGAYGDIEVQPLSRIRKLSARNVAASWRTVPHVTQHDDADITELERFRKQAQTKAQAAGTKLTPLAFLLKASALVLRRHPDFRSSLTADGEGLVVKHYFHIGVAVDTEQGLVVPVVRDVDRKGLLELAAELGDLSTRARAKKLVPSDLQGACFTISSLGGIGGTGFSPIVNAPEVAILGVSRASIRPVWVEGDGSPGEFVPRNVLPLSLSYDHRVIDGAEAVRFVRNLCQTLEDVANLLL